MESPYKTWKPICVPLYLYHAHDIMAIHIFIFAYSHRLHAKNKPDKQNKMDITTYNSPINHN